MTSPDRPTVPPPTEAQIEELLTRGVVTVEIRENLEKKLKSGRQLRVKMGFDPSAPDIHLGHTIGMRKLRAFQELGHKVVIIVGDWTAQIGDPSGRSAQRQMLTAEEVKEHAQTYLDQFFTVVDPNPELVEIRWQSTWFGDFDLADVMRLTSKFTVAQMLARDDFTNRYNQGAPIGIVEFLYPLLQAYDSVAVEADVEMGGTDQTFNLLVGRDIQREMGQPPQDILTVPILVGTDGVQKMSKSLGNYVGVSEPPAEMYGKLMSIPDAILPDYLTLASTIPAGELAQLLESLNDPATNPRDVKDRMAANIVEAFHDRAAAEAAREAFQRVYREHQAPEDMPEKSVNYPASIVDLLKVAELVNSNNEARRLIKQGGVRIDGERVEDAELVCSFDRPVVLQAGKRRFVRLVSS